MKTTTLRRGISSLVILAAALLLASYAPSANGDNTIVNTRLDDDQAWITQQIPLVQGQIGSIEEQIMGLQAQMDRNTQRAASAKDPAVAIRLMTDDNDALKRQIRDLNGQLKDKKRDLKTLIGTLDKIRARIAKLTKGGNMPPQARGAAQDVAQNTAKNATRSAAQAGAKGGSTDAVDEATKTTSKKAAKAGAHDVCPPTH
jgi:chromosome segregation ATPase